MAKIILTLSFFSFWCFFANAQFTATNSAPYNTATHLINNVFAGGQVTTNNITSYGNSSQFGFFTGNTTLGLDSGIILSTGTVEGLCSGNCPNASTNPGNPGSANGTTFGFPWMGTGITNNNLYNVSASVPNLLGFGTAPNDVNDAAAISFNFTPISDTMRFRFIFASSEWPSWPCSQYNDVFGFFVSGPGITGSFFSPPGFPNGAENYAVVPGTNIPITITSINAPNYSPNSCTNSYPNLFIPNSPTLSGITSHYTTVMEVKFPTQPCENYNFTMAIADGSDGSLNSYVLLEANSFTPSNSMMSFSSSYGLGGDSIFYEGCGSSELQLQRATNIQSADTVIVSIQGTATNGIDCSLIPDTIIFQPGQTLYSQTIQIFNDNLIEGPETLEVYVSDTNFISCSGGSDTTMIVIHDPLPLISDASSDTITCEDNSLIISANASGLSPLNYIWSNNAQSGSALLNPMPTTDTSFIVTITDACNIYTLIDTAHVFMDNPPFYMTLEDDTIDCTDNGASITPNLTGATPNISYQWSNASVANSIFVTPTSTTTYYLTVTDACGINSVVDSSTINYVNKPFTVLPVNKVFSCIGDSVTLAIQASGGYPPFTYSWSTGSTDSTTDILTTQPVNNFIVSVTDDCSGNVIVSTVTAQIHTYSPLKIDTLFSDTFNCPGEVVAMGSTKVRGGSGDYIVSWDDWLTTNNFFTETIDTTITFTIQATDNCNYDSTLSTVTYVVRDHDQLRVILPADTQLCEQDLITINSKTLGGAGNFSYEWNTGAKTSYINSQTNSSQLYRVTVTDDCDKTAQEEMEISISSVTAEFEHQFFDPQTVRFMNRSEGAHFYHWDFGDQDTTSNYFEPLKVYENSNNYDVLLIAYDSVGCLDSAYHEITPPLNSFIPNAFTPNGDGLNDVFELYGGGFYKGDDLKEFSIEIFDRWGALVFSSNDYNFTWDGTYNGKQLQNGTYIYKITLHGYKQQKVELSGFINIVE